MRNLMDEIKSTVIKCEMDEFEYLKKKVRYDICFLLLKQSYTALGILDKRPPNELIMENAEAISSALKCPTDKLETCFKEAILTKMQMEYPTPINFGDLDHALKFGYVVRAQDIGDMSHFLPDLNSERTIWSLPSVQKLANEAGNRGFVRIVRNDSGSKSIAYRKTPREITYAD